MISLADQWVHPEWGFRIDPRTLARHLGRVVRFGGAVNTWYSVLQHSLFVADVAGILWSGPALAATDVRLSDVSSCALLHDAHEFIGGDVPTDWKTDERRAAEVCIDAHIARALGINHAYDSRVVDVVKEADQIALLVEANYVSPGCLILNPDKFARPDLVEKWGAVFRRFYCPDPQLAFWMNWERDGVYVATFARRLEAALRLL